jgi:hypothetical protein
MVDALSETSNPAHADPAVPCSRRVVELTDAIPTASGGSLGLVGNSPSWSFLPVMLLHAAWLMDAVQDANKRSFVSPSVVVFMAEDHSFLPFFSSISILSCM